MRISAIWVQNIKPVSKFELEDLSDLVVIAGANGVGKTRLLNAILSFLQNPATTGAIRLLVQATNPQEQKDWGKLLLDTAVQEDAEFLRATLQVNRRRNNYKSTVMYFESNRTFQQVKPLAFAFEFPDPFSEDVPWKMGFGGLSGRAQDTQHAILKLVQKAQNDIAKRAIELRQAGQEEMKLDFPDPLEMFKGPFNNLLSPKTLEGANLQQQKLYYLEGEKKLALENLSSGERQVVDIVFDFILRNPKDSVIFFDEPELHLHPELVQRLVQTLSIIGERNQFIFCTHSPSVITASLDNTVVFVSPPQIGGGNQALQVHEDDETQLALKLLGQSIGVIALGNKIVMIEGTHSSLDKEVYWRLIQKKHPDFVLVPSESKGTVASFSETVSHLLDKSVWGVEFFMLCDRDAAPSNLSTKAGTGPHPNFSILNRYHLENYFLDERVLALVFEEMESEDSWLRSPENIREKLREIGHSIISYAVALHVSSLLRFEVGNIDIMAKGVHSTTSDELVSLLSSSANSERNRISEIIDEERIKNETESAFERLSNSIVADDNTWKTELPGRQILKKFAAEAGINYGKLRRLYLNKATTVDDSPFQEIMDIFERFESA